MKKPILDERFWSKVNKSGQLMPHMKTRCHEWAAAIEKVNGYGKYSPYGQAGWDRAHRVVWKASGRPLLPGECVLHKCDNRRCVRLSHLYAGTKKHNAQDRERRGRSNHAVGARHGCATHPGLRKGSKNGRAKLDEAAVVKLLQEFKQGSKKADLARKYALTKTTVGYIVSGKLWPHVERG